MIRRAGCLVTVALLFILGLTGGRLWESVELGDSAPVSDVVVLPGNQTGESWFTTWTVWQGDVRPYAGQLRVAFSIALAQPASVAGVAWRWICDNRSGQTGGVPIALGANTYHSVGAETGSAGIFRDDDMTRCAFMVWSTDASEQAFKINAASFTATLDPPDPHASDPVDVTPGPSPTPPPPGIFCTINVVGHGGMCSANETYTFMVGSTYRIEINRTAGSASSQDFFPILAGQYSQSCGINFDPDWSLGIASGVPQVFVGTVESAPNPCSFGGHTNGSSSGTYTVTLQPWTTNPNGDDDGDGWNNGIENAWGTDPNDPDDHPFNFPDPTPPPEVPQGQEPGNEVAEFCRTNPTAGLCDEQTDMAEYCAANPNAGACDAITDIGEFCAANPTAGACAPVEPGETGAGAEPSLAPGVPGGAGGGLGGGAAGCEPTYPKPGQLEYDETAIEGVPDGSLNPLDYFAWIGRLIGNTPAAIGNTVKWLWNLVVDAIVPSDCLGDLIDQWVADVSEIPPLSWALEVKSSIDESFDYAAGGVTVPLGTFTVAGASYTFDWGDVMGTVEPVVAPYRGIIGAGAYIFLTSWVFNLWLNFFWPRENPQGKSAS